MSKRGRPPKSAIAAALDGQRTLSLGLTLSSPSHSTKLSSTTGYKVPRTSSTPGGTTQSMTHEQHQAPDDDAAYAELGPSASQVNDASEVSIQLSLLQEKDNSLIMAEVSDVLDACIDAVISTVSVAKVKQHRNTFKHKQKSAVVEAFEKLSAEHSSMSSNEVTSKLREAAKLPKSFKLRPVRQWSKCGPTKKRGPKVSSEFEREVLDQMIFTTLTRVDNEEKAGIVANVIYSHDVIQQAAMQVQKKYQHDKRVAKCKFTRPWINGWLQR
eukprot:CAMPEP_0183354396 /NCGR_PEP_ID=MMETSP0164_2-20130417/37285_1 /TAXON_ID=221442 /ORGANISM="Coccolithus pelagicus ssp braarudi, Strain PLY182g" /LENGTH=269 /DNA_ID=CAMNT_0025527271 /DNA_START=30 /DNA_END=836 /DNA_ORIENTATION=-